MFKHSLASECNYEKSGNRFCQLHHYNYESRDTISLDKEQMVGQENVNINDSIDVDNEFSSDSEQEDLDCEDCGKVFEDFYKMIEH